MERPLEGIRVLDLTRVAAGPFATMLMADLGAEIVKVERPGSGDEVRALGGPLPGGDPNDTDYYLGMNRSKRSVAINLSEPEGTSLTRRLAAVSDVVMENFRPGVADRMGIGFDDLRALRPGLVYTSISGFGPTGPWSKRPANDVMMQSLSGLMGVTGERGGPPVRLGTSICDLATGLFALSGTVTALYVRTAHPEGQHIEVPMLDASIALMPNLIPGATLGMRPKRMGREHPQIIGYGSFECADGGFVTVGAFSEVFWSRLCALIGREEWLDDPQLTTNTGRLRNRSRIDDELKAAFLRRSRSEWVEALESADIPCAPVLELDEAIQSEQAVHNGVVHWLKSGDVEYGVVRNPIRSAEWAEAVYQPAEALGESTEAVLTSLLGLSSAEVAGLAKRGVVVPGESDQR